MQITKKTELMFTQAVSLAQSGRLKSHIHGLGNILFIANMDNTILLKMAPDMTFPAPGLSFFANDYESPNVELAGENVVFVTTKSGYVQHKTCGVPKTSFADVQAIWDRHTPVMDHKILVRKEILPLLDSELSHVEFHNDKGTLKMVQKNIYTGGRVEVKDSNGSQGFISIHNFPPSFNPVGIRTVDLTALFQFVDTLAFYPQPSGHWMYFKDTSGVLEGILSTCVYDELGYHTESMG